MSNSMSKLLDLIVYSKSVGHKLEYFTSQMKYMIASEEK